MSERIEVGHATVEYRIWGDGPPQIVMLHDGLGSVAQWRDTPEVLAERTGVAVMAYNRPGHGASTPVPNGPWPTRWLHAQADLLTQLLAELDIIAPLLVGHSDGGSIALLHAASGAPCRGLVALAPHSFVESICVAAISAMRAAPERIVRSLDPYHDHAGAVFDAWSGVWVSDEFARWDVRHQLGSISCPTVVVQGDADGYATEAQLRSTVAAVGPAARGVLLDGVGHLIHHECHEVVVDIVARTFADAAVDAVE